jgi:hypothetical protein
MRIGKELIPMHKLLVLAVVLLITSFKHPMHVTVLEVEFDEESKAVEMSMHVFADDLEDHLKIIKKNNELEILELNEEQRNKLLSEYMVRYMAMKINEKEQVIVYVGHEVEGEALWVFLEVKNVKKIKTFEIENSVLIDVFDDQANLIHFEHEGEVYSEKLDRKVTRAKYDLSNL